MKDRLSSFKKEQKGDIREEPRQVFGECLLHRELGRKCRKQIGWRTSLTFLAMTPPVLFPTPPPSGKCL